MPVPVYIEVIRVKQAYVCGTIPGTCNIVCSQYSYSELKLGMALSNAKLYV